MCLKPTNVMHNDCNFAFDPLPPLFFGNPTWKWLPGLRFSGDFKVPPQSPERIPQGCGQGRRAGRYHAWKQGFDTCCPCWDLSLNKNRYNSWVHMSMNLLNLQCCGLCSEMFSQSMHSLPPRQHKRITCSDLILFPPLSGLAGEEAPGDEAQDEASRSQSTLTTENREKATSDFMS